MKRSGSLPGRFVRENRELDRDSSPILTALNARGHDRCSQEITAADEGSAVCQPLIILLRAITAIIAIWR